MTMKIILLSWSYIFIHCTRATAYPTKTIFHLPRKHNVQCTGKKMVIILHDNEGMKPWLMGPNLCFTISRCQNRVQGNKVTVQYFGAMLNCHNAKQGLMFVSNIYRNNYEISINAYTYMHINIYMHIYIYAYIDTHVHLKAIVRRTIYYFNASDHHVKFDTGQCCNNRRMCFLNDPIEQIGLILDKIKFHTWGPI